MIFRYLAIFTIIFLLSACTVVQVEKIPLQTPADVPAEARPSPVGFNEIRYAIPTGSTTMGISSRSPRCPLVMRKVNQGISGRSFPSDEYNRIFRDTLQGLGYDITGDPGRMFDEQEDRQRTIYSVGARVIDLKMDVCTEQSFLFGYDIGTVGEAMVEVEWTVYDMLRRKNVYKTRTKGYSELKGPNDEGIALLLEDSFAAAAHNLGADQAFFDLVFKGAEPLNKPDTFEDPDESPLPRFDTTEDVDIAPRALSATPAQDHMQALMKTAVLVQTAGVHGSGFFITKDGHILTNAHVVGYARRVRVVMSGKQKALFAEVLRVDRARDVALLRLEEPPEGFMPVILPVKTEKPPVGADVFAIGAPAKTSLQDTVTKGIVSAHRYDKRKKLWFLQADVYIHGGSSGGPLIDAHGNIVGLSVSGYVDGEQALSGLNLFIPIGDALDALRVGTDEGGAPLALKKP